MAASAVALVLLSAAIHVGWNLLVKSSADPRAFSAVKGLPFLVLTVLVVAAVPLDDLSPVVWGCIAASGIVHAVYVVGLSSAYVEGDLSLVYPITRSSPALVPLAAFFLLDERIAPQAAGGIAVVVASILLLHGSGGSSDAGSSGWRGLFTLRGFARNRYAFLTLASVVAYSLIDKAGMEAFRTSLAVEGSARAFVFFILVNGVSFALFWAWMGARGLSGVGHALRHEWKLALVASAGTLASYTLILHVFQTERVSYVVALRQSSVLVAVLVGWFWLGEPGGRSRLTAALALLSGLAMVALSR